MDVSGRVLRAWMPAIHAGMTGTADGLRWNKMRFVLPTYASP